MAEKLLTSKNASDLRQAFQIFQALALAGNATAQCNLATLYGKGLGTNVDFEQAFLWMKKAADQRLAIAERFMGGIFLSGTAGQKKDADEALRWFLNAAEDGDLIAQIQLVDLYSNSLLHQHSFSKAFSWAIKVAERREISGAYYLARLYYTGDQGKGSDLEKAYTWTQIASESKSNVLPEEAQEEIKQSSAQLKEMISPKLDVAQINECTEKSKKYLEVFKRGGFCLGPDLILDAASDLSEVRGNFQLAAGVILLPLYINGSGPFNFIIDTGSSFSAIENNIAENLKLINVGVHPNLEKDPELRSVVQGKAALFKSEIGLINFLSVPLSDFSKTVGIQVDGFLGYDFISRFFVRVDYRDSSILLKSPDCPFEGGDLIPITLVDGIPHVMAQLHFPNHDLISALFLIDTANDRSVTVNYEFDQKYKFSELVSHPASERSAEITGNKNTLVGNALDLKIGNSQFSMPEVELDLENRFQNSAGEIGNQIWNKKILEISYLKSQIELN